MYIIRISGRRIVFLRTCILGQALVSVVVGRIAVCTLLLDLRGWLIRAYAHTFECIHT